MSEAPKAIRDSVYKGASFDAHTARERRRQESTLATGQHRSAQLRAKRLKREQSGSGEGYIALLDADTLTSTFAEIKQLLDCPAGSEGQLRASTKLRQLICAAGDAAVSSGHHEKAEQILSRIREGNVLTKLITSLLPKTQSEVLRTVAFESCWTLSNLAALDHACGRQVLDAAPVLIALLSAGFGYALAEQSAWALGNLAGDCEEFRSRLLANGALLPLARLSSKGRIRSEGAATVAAAQTATWALCNLVKDVGPEVRQLVSTEAFGPNFLQLLGRDDAPGLVTEAAWLTSYITAAPGNLLPLEDVLPPLLTVLQKGLSQAGEDGVELKQALTPILRSIGNLTASGSQTAIAKCFGGERGGPAARLIVSSTSCQQHGAAKEATWVLSNLAAVRNSDGARTPILKDTGGIDRLAALVKQGTFPIRKEAAYGLANAIACEPGLLPGLVGSNQEEVADGILPWIANLADTADAEAAQLALRFFATVLQVLPEGAEIVESVDGIEVLEKQQIGGAEENQVLATAMLDKHFGNDYGA